MSSIWLRQRRRLPGFFGEALFGGHIRCCGHGGLGFRPYGDLLFLQTPKKSKQKNACSYVRPSQARVPSLRDRSGRSGYGLLRCTSLRCVWLRQTVAALPSPDQSLRSAFRCRPWIKIKSGTRANAHCVEWGGMRRVRGVLVFLWELACQRWRPDSRSISN